MKNVNYKMRILQAIAMILIVLGHSGGIYLLNDWFVTDSFTIALFIFISGYFYNKSDEQYVANFVKYKFKKLIIPLYIWNIVYGIFITLLLKFDIVEFGHKISFKSYFIEPWTIGNQFGLNVASWFITILFVIQIIYLLIRKIVDKLKIYNEYMMMCILWLVGILGVYISNSGLNYSYYLLLVRCMFLIQFYHMGYLYKNKIEGKYFINNLRYFAGIFSLQYIIKVMYGEIGTIVFSGHFNKENIILPFIGALLGIMVWIRVADILLPSLKDSKIIQSIGENTWTIMMHHQVVFFIINIILLNISKRVILPGFDIEMFRVNEWYKYNPFNNGFMIIYCFLGVYIPLLLKNKLQKLRAVLNRK